MYNRLMLRAPLYLLTLIVLLAGTACDADGPPPITSTPTLPDVATSEPLPSETAANEGPAEAIYISSPGSSSMVVSPLEVAGQADPTFEQNLVIAIYAEDGTQLALAPATIQADLGYRGPYSLELEFSVESQQAGRITVYSTSARDGGIIHLNSVDVVLLPSGSSQISTNTEELESILIESPANGDRVSGGVIQLSGFSDYYFESNLGMVLCGPGGSGAPDELCGTEDNALARGAVTIQAPDVGQPGPFSAEINYSVMEPTPARLLLYATSPRDGGLIHVSSVNLELAP